MVGIAAQRGVTNRNSNRNPEPNATATTSFERCSLPGAAEARHLRRQRQSAQRRIDWHTQRARMLTNVYGPMSARQAALATVVPSTPLQAAVLGRRLCVM